MASISNVPREFESGIRDAVGPNTKIYIKRIMKLEVKPEKYEKRVVALAGCRLMILTAKVQTKVEQNISYLDIQALESKKENQLSVTIDNKTLNFVTLDAETDDVNLIITHIGRSIKNVFPAFPLERFIRTIEVHPPSRLKTMYDLIRDVDHKETGPCGGFSMMYACMCDYYNLPYREEVAWDVDTIYLSQDSRELCLQDFDHLNSKDLIPIVSALEHNTWFTKLNANDVKLNMETQNEIQKVMLRNAVIEELHLSNTGITADFVSKLATAVLSNAGSQLSKVDLSKNTLSDQALISFIGSLKNLSKGLVSFNMASTKVTGKGLNKIAETLSNNPNITLTLQYLNMSDNPNPKGDDLQSLYSLLAQPNNLTHLDLSGIDCSLESLCGALLRGSCPSLTHLYVSRNVFSQRKGKEVIPQGTWKTFFSSVYGLEVLDLSSCRLPPEALKELLLGIASNINLKNLDLDLSNNDLQMPGAAILGDSLSNITSVTSLDVSNNGFEQSLEKFLDAMKANSSVKHLAIGQNFSKVKNPPMVLESVVNLIQDENSTIESLSLADSKLKNHLSVVINALGSNTTLTEIDISGNSVGDLGARMLSKALQINNKLRSILWDRNNVGPQGFEDVANALKKNFTVKKMPSPLTDIGKVLEERKENTKERTEAAIKEIESALQRNHSPQKYSSDQGYRLQQGFLISSTQQMVDRLVVQVQDTINALGRLGSGESHQGDVDKASCVIKDADNSKQLLPQLQNIAMKSCDVGNPIEKQLQQMAADLKEVLNTQMKKTVSEMVECTTNQCAGVTADKTFMEELVGGCSEKSSLPPHFTKNVLDSVETSVYNKLSELNLAVAAYISDKTLEGVIEALHSSHKTLTNEMNKKRSESIKAKDEKSNKDKENQEKAENEETEKPVMRQSKALDSPMSPSYRVSFFEEKNSPCSTPDLSTKRKNFSSRRMRPPTVVDAEQVKKALMMHEAKTASCIPESDLEQGSEVKVRDSIISVSSRPESIVDSQEDLAALDTDIKPSRKQSKSEVKTLPPIEIDELPSLQTPNLQHLGKNRAKGPQRRRPTPRPQVASDVGDSGMKEDEGLNSFFQSNTVSTNNVVSTNVSVTDSPEPSKNEKKGKKPERKESLEKTKVPSKPEKPSKTDEPKKKGFFGRRASEDKEKEKSKPFSLFSRKKPSEPKPEPAAVAKKPEPPSAAKKPEPPPAAKKPEPPPSTNKPDRKGSVTSTKSEDTMSPVSEEKEETENEKTEEEQGEESKPENSEEQDESKSQMRPKKPIGGIGFGMMGAQMGNIMSEMQMKRFSQIQAEKKQRMPDKAIVPPSMLKKKREEKPAEATKPEEKEPENKKDDLKNSNEKLSNISEETQKVAGVENGKKEEEKDKKEEEKDKKVEEKDKKEEEKDKKEEEQDKKEEEKDKKEEEKEEEKDKKAEDKEPQAEKIEENSEKKDNIPNGEPKEEKEESQSNRSSEDLTKDETDTKGKEDDQKSMKAKEGQEKEKEDGKSMEGKVDQKAEEKEKEDRKSVEIRKSVELRKSVEVKEQAKEKEEPERKRHSILATVQARQKPAPAPRGSTSSSKPEPGEVSKTSSNSSLSSNSSRASDELKPKPSPPVKPRPPPKTAPKPKADSADADASDKQEDGVVVDSATLRLSVGEKIKRLSQNFSSNPPTPENALKRRSQNFSPRPPSAEIAAAKSSSLPRDVTSASVDDANKEKVKERSSLPLDGKDVKEEEGDEKNGESNAKTNNGTDSSGGKPDSSDNKENGLSPEEKVIMV